MGVQEFPSFKIRYILEYLQIVKIIPEYTLPMPKYGVFL
jgi:hypothetical protein